MPETPPSDPRPRIIQGSIPSVVIFVVHSAQCPYKDDPYWKRCKCWKHLRWSHGGQQHRPSARTRSWARAEQEKRRIESQYSDGASGPPVIEKAVRTTIEYGIQLFLKDRLSQGVNGSVHKKYDRELGRFEQFMGARGRTWSRKSGWRTLPSTKPHGRRSTLRRRHAARSRTV